MHLTGGGAWSDAVASGCALVRGDRCRAGTLGRRDRGVRGRPTRRSSTRGPRGRSTRGHAWPTRSSRAADTHARRKGLRDLHTLLGQPGSDVPALVLSIPAGRRLRSPDASVPTRSSTSKRRLATATASPSWTARSTGRSTATTTVEPPSSIDDRQAFMDELRRRRARWPFLAAWRRRRAGAPDRHSLHP
jgi:hypothetical protein